MKISKSLSLREIADSTMRESAPPTELKKRKLEELSEAIAFASRQAAGNMSAEFLGESRVALRLVLREGGVVLTAQERADLSDVLGQIDDALDRR